MTTHSYNVDIKWEHGRVGIMCSPEVGAFKADNGCLTIATPPEFPKGMAGIWSPEHLFTAAVSSCLMTTFLAIAENSKLAFTNFKCKSEGKLEQVDGKFVMTEILLFPEVTISKGEDRDKAIRVLQRSEAACLISNSIKSKVSMQPLVNVAVGDNFV